MPIAGKESHLRRLKRRVRFSLLMFDDIVRKGSQVVPDAEQEKQLYLQQQELELLREEN